MHIKENTMMTRLYQAWMTTWNAYVEVMVTMPDHVDTNFSPVGKVFARFFLRACGLLFIPVLPYFFIKNLVCHR